MLKGITGRGDLTLDVICRPIRFDGAESRRTAAISSVKSGVFAGDADSALCLSSVHTSLSREAKVTLRRDRCHLRTEEGHLCLYTLLIGLFCCHLGNYLSLFL